MFGGVRVTRTPPRMITGGHGHGLFVSLRETDCRHHQRIESASKARVLGGPSCEVSENQRHREHTGKQVLPPRDPSVMALDS